MNNKSPFNNLSKQKIKMILDSNFFTSFFKNILQKELEKKREKKRLKT